MIINMADTDIMQDMLDRDTIRKMLLGVCLSLCLFVPFLNTT